MASGSDLQLPAYVDAVSSLAFHKSNPNKLLAGSWDRSVYLHELDSPSTPKKLPLRGAVLDVAWGANDDVYAGGLSKEVRSVDFETGATSLIATHNDAVKCVEYQAELNAIISASWDSTIHVTPTNTGASALTLPVPAKVYSLALSPTKIVAAMGGRAVWIWDTRNLSQTLQQSHSEEEVKAEVWQKRESSLKFMTRAVRCMPNDQGYATTSIEGRVAVEFFDADPAVQAKKYAFKCHRQLIDGVDTVYPVQGLAFNPVHGTFATGGGDCTVSVWDPAAKKRLRQFPKYGSPISALEFNSDGTKLAVGYSEEDEGGLQSERNGNGIVVRNCGDECKPKPKP